MPDVSDIAPPLALIHSYKQRTNSKDISVLYKFVLYFLSGSD
jgi:hypothetical protein